MGGIDDVTTNRPTTNKEEHNRQLRKELFESFDNGNTFISGRSVDNFF